MSFQIYKFKLFFTHQLVTAKGIFSTREGLLVSASIDGRVCWSEVSPLPGFSVTTLEECQDWFKSNGPDFWTQLIDKLSTTSKQKSIQETIKVIVADAQTDFPLNTPPEIHFAFDTLLFQTICQKSDLRPQYDIHIGVNATASDLLTSLSQIKKGYKTIKLKIGLDWPSEINTILLLRNQYPEVRLRLDANESWSVNETKFRLQELENLDIEYIEQPVNQSELIEYGIELRSFGTPIAADESARSLQSIQELIRNNSVDVFILKPPMLGSFRRIHDACYEIMSSGNRMIFTSSLDSSLNVSMAALLASIWAQPDDMHGFSTGSLFEKDLNPTRSDISDSTLTLDTSWIIHPDFALDKSLITPLC